MQVEYVPKYFKKLLFEKKGNFFGDIFNLDDDEIAINLYHDEDVVIDLLNKIQKVQSLKLII